ncbi:MAG: serine protease [Candidatus Korobacteraceae bacterium]|jgi:hypothetical protein
MSLWLLLLLPVALGGIVSAQQINIDPLSVRSVLLQLSSSGQVIATGTGFIVHKAQTDYLVTNWHVMTGRRPDNGAPLDSSGRTPDEIRVLHNVKGKLGSWKWESEPLFQNGQPRWIEHKRGRVVDVAFLPLTKTQNVEIYPTDLELRKTPIRLLPAGTVSIIGFPFGRSSFLGLPIWKTGSIASDPDIDYDNLPEFLVDATVRPGMSGSPVYARRIGSYMDENGNTNIITGSADRFVGIFAGVIDQYSEVGRVWKASAILDIYDNLK